MLETLARGFNIILLWLQTLLGQTPPQMHKPKVEYESNEFLVINKTFDLVMYDQASSGRESVESCLDKYFPEISVKGDSKGFYFAHRLDYSTSGLLCIAKNVKACALAGKAFADRKAHKYYLALLRGHVSVESIDINYTIDESVVREFYAKDGQYPALKRQAARTKLIVLEKGFCYGYPATKVLIKIYTGRRHQIRIHSAMLGHRVVGDYTYSKRYDSETYRMFLHSFKLQFHTSVDTVDAQTEDPFTCKNKSNQWIPSQKINNLDRSVFEKFEGKFALVLG